MDYFDREALINKIICGYTVCIYDGESVIVHEPNPVVKAKAQEVYKKVYNRAMLSDNPTFDEMLEHMILTGLWDNRRQKELDESTIKIEAGKIELYESYFNFKKRDGIKKIIDSLRFRELQLMSERDAYRFVTCEGAAAAAKNKFLICESTTTLDGHPLFPLGWEKYPNSKIETFTQSFFENKVDESVLRDLCKTEPWRSIWSAGKAEGSVFGKPSSLLTNEQRMLLIWSKIYDSIYESPDCPPEEVLNDDDMMDGWMILNSRKREAEKKESHGFKPGDKFANSDEVYIFADDAESAARVEAMNSAQARVIKQQRMRALEGAGGKIAEQHMPDSMVAIRDLAAKQLRNRRK